MTTAPRAPPTIAPVRVTLEESVALLLASLPVFGGAWVATCVRVLVIVESTPFVSKTDVSTSVTIEASCCDRDEEAMASIAFVVEMTDAVEENSEDVECATDIELDGGRILAVLAAEAGLDESWPPTTTGKAGVGTDDVELTTM
jgi:hypothetical protein